MNVCRAVSLVALLSDPASLAAAQQPADASVASMLTVGTRVRVRATTVQTRIRGVVVAVDDTLLTVAPDGGLPLKLPVSSISATEISLGRRRNWLKGLGIGAASGAALGFALPVDADDCGPDAPNLCSRGQAVASGAIFFGGVGVGIGALIKTERWAPIGVGLRLPNVTNGRRSIGVTFATRF